MATNTAANIGISRECSTLGMRNYEPLATVAYKSNRPGLWFNGSQFAVGSTLTFDVGGVSYSAAAKQTLELFWNQGWILPVV